MTKYFLDSEFGDNGKTIDLISLGIVCEDGRELYLQSTEFKPSNASPWVEEHVITRLLLCPHVPVHGNPSALVDRYAHESKGQCTFTRPAAGITGLRGVKVSGGHLIGAYADCFWRTREQMRNEVRAFITDPTELWGWCSGYDWVALCQLFGTMMDVPAGWPHYMRDLQQILDERGIADADLPAQEENVHHALADARHLKKLWEYLVRNDCNWTGKAQ